MWSMIDANGHLRHSAYADLAAQARTNLLDKSGLTFDEFSKKLIGPILFKETLVYHREVRMHEDVRVTAELSRYNTKNSRFSFRQVIYKGDNIKCATIDVDGAFMDLTKRKLTKIPEDWTLIFERIPKSDDYLETIE